MSSALDQILLIPGIGRRDVVSQLRSLLFSDGEAGGMWFPFVSNSVRAERTGDSATTISGVGDAVGTVLDLSGNNNHWTTTDDSKRGLLSVDSNGKRFILTDGIDDFYQTPVITAGSDEMFVCIAFRGVTTGMQFEFSTNINTNNGACYLLSSNQFASKGTVIQGTAQSISGLQVRAMDAKISEPIARQRVNQGSWVENTDSQGTGNYLNHRLFVSMRAGISIPISMEIYGMILRFKRTPVNVISDVETILAAKAGVVF